jgi:tetratricopeptide (TPR) repeat protein
VSLNILLFDKIDRLKNWQVATIIAVIGFGVFFTGLHSPFQGDDLTQIINNAPVHSIKNILLFFKGGTFSPLSSGGHLAGAYYRPLMTTSFSLIYSIFGPNPLYFHLFQLLLSIGSSIILFLFFRYSFKPTLSLVLALFFLISPIDSQLNFSVPATQDNLYFFFGILALYLLIRLRSSKSLLIVVACLLLSLFSKESGVVFEIIAALYLYIWNRERLLKFLMIDAVPVVAWLLLRIHAVGISNNPHNAPILNLSISSRLIMIPSIISFYFFKLIFPLKLASAYYWVYPKISFSHFLIPLLFDLLIAGIITYIAIYIKKNTNKATYYTYLFFIAWLCLGLLFIIQIVPLDMTVCENWFEFSMVGALGIIGIGISNIGTKHMKNVSMLVLFAVLIVFGVRTLLRGRDWSSEYNLSRSDISASKEDYVAYNNISSAFLNNGDYRLAAYDAGRSIYYFPNWSAYNNLGAALTPEGNYAAAMKAYESSLSYEHTNLTYENLGRLSLLYGSVSNNETIFKMGLNYFPKDATLWTWYALFEEEHNQNTRAITAINKAAQYGESSGFNSDIINNVPFTLQVTSNLNSVVKI